MLLESDSRDVHRLQLLEEQLRGVGDVELRARGLVLAGAALEALLFLEKMSISFHDRQTQLAYQVRNSSETTAERQVRR